MIINENAAKGSTLQTIHDLGATSYCTVGDDTTARFSLAIGGCGLRQIDLVNAYASIARGGVYKPQSSVLEVKNSSGETLKKWADVAGKQVVSNQATYVVDDILSDTNASKALGSYAAKNIPGVKTATKTGTSDKGGQAKDLWMMSYSPALTMGVWLGNPDTTVLRNGTSSLGSPIVASVMEYAHKEIYAPEGKWKSGDWFVQPTGIQKVGIELYPAWWNKTQGQANAKLTFDKVSKNKATSCTPDGAKLEADVIKIVDPVTKKDIYTNVPSGYDATKDDDAHACGDAQVSASFVVTPAGAHKSKITVTAAKGKFDPTTITISVGGTVVTTLNASATGGEYTYDAPDAGSNGKSVTVTVTDSGYYVVNASGSGTVSY